MEGDLVDFDVAERPDLKNGDGCRRLGVVVGNLCAVAPAGIDDQRLRFGGCRTAKDSKGEEKTGSQEFHISTFQKWLKGG